MTALLILFVVILIGCIIRYSIEAGEKKIETKGPAPIKKTLPEMSIDELNEELSNVEVDLEMQKMKYQSSLANPYVWNTTRELVKSNLEYLIKRKLEIEKEIAGRNV